MSSRKPHLIYLMADQLRADVIGPCGGRQCPTPNLDALAADAAIFDHHVTPSPICVPTRSSIMTGLEAHQHGALINGWRGPDTQHGLVRPGTELLPDHLAAAGYRVAHHGIQHVATTPSVAEHFENSPVDIGWPTRPGEVYAKLKEQGVTHAPITGSSDVIVEFARGKPVYSRGSNPQTQVCDLKPEQFFDSVVADRLIEQIRSHDGDQPLAMFGMFWLPHPPLWVPEPYYSMFNPDDIDLPATVGQICGDHPPTNMLTFPGQVGSHVPMHQWRKAWAVYLGMVAFLDHCIGRVIDALKDAGMYDDSLVVFTSDHGEMLGSHGMFQKMCLYEPAVRIPLLVKAPADVDAIRGQHVDVLTSHVDTAATFTDAAGAKPMPGAAGCSLLPVLKAEPCAASERNWIFSAFDGCQVRAWPARMARSRSHKLIYNRDDHDELYDLKNDPDETANLSGKPEAASIEREARAALQAWMKQAGDDLAPCPDAKPAAAAGSNSLI